MKESTLINIALNATLLGILMLIIIGNKVSIDSSLIVNLTKEEEYVKVQGVITRSTETPGLYLLDIEDKSGSITVVVFKREENITLNKNQIIEVEGKTVSYKGKMEITADKIIALS